MDSELTNQAFTPFIYELHGNGFFMHCSNEDNQCSHKIVPAPTLQDLDAAYDAAPVKEFTNVEGFQQNFCKIPVCEECGAPMKPHVMYFDETYNEHYYRAETIQDYVANTDIMILVGTAIETSMCKRLVVNTLEKEIPIIEINMESAINRGHNLQILGKAEENLPALFEAYYTFLGGE